MVEKIPRYERIVISFSFKIQRGTTCAARIFRKVDSVRNYGGNLFLEDVTLPAGRRFVGIVEYFYYNIMLIGDTV